MKHKRGFIALSLACLLSMSSCTLIDTIKSWFTTESYNNNDNGNSNNNNGNSGDNGNNNTGKTGSATLKVISVNDFHGIVEKSSTYPGLSAYGAKLKALYDSDPDNTILLSAGDMFQGSGVSSITRGKVVADGMNYLKFDCMTLGNHEFDWGLDAIRMAHDGVAVDFDNDTNTAANLEVDCPYLGCNIYYNNGTSSTSDDTYASDLCEPYCILERGDMKIGVIGYIGPSQLSSICATISAPLAFHDPASIIGDWAEYLRTEKGCNFIIANGHDGDSGDGTSDTINNQLIALTGNKSVDYILNSHTHCTYLTELTTNKYVIQSGCYGSNIGYATFEYSFDSNSVVSASVQNIYKNDYSSMEDSTLTAIVNKHVTACDPVINEVIGKNGTSSVNTTNGTTKKNLCLWISDCVREQVGADYGVTNYSGVRTGAGTVNANANITVNTMMGIMPFDNSIVVCKMYGSILKSILSGSYYGHSFNYSESDITDTKVYSVAFDEFSYGKISSQCISYQFSEYCTRDAMINEVRYNTSKDLTWDITRVAAFNS